MSEVTGLIGSDLIQRVADSLPGQMAYWDKDLICRFANRAYLDLFSFSLDKIIGIHMRSLLGDELFESNYENIEGVLRGRTQAFLRPISRVDGSSATVHVQYVPDFNDAAVTGFFVSVNDVTEFKRIEDELRRKEAELQLHVCNRDDAITWLELAEETANVGHWRLDTQSGAMSWSDGMFRIYGLQHDAPPVTLETSLSFYHPEDRAHIEVSLRKTLEDGASFDLLGRVLRPDGETRYVRTRGLTADGTSAAAPSTIFGVLVDVTEQHEAEQALRIANNRLRSIAHVDGLTGISNRRRFDEQLEHEWRIATRNDSAISVILLDVDNFKIFNDRYGHLVGDDCLMAVADAIGSVACRPQDLVARFGGEEFVVLLPATDLEGATSVAERARAAVEALGRAHAGNIAGVVTISAGVASFDSLRTRPGTQRQLLGAADAMLYKAKTTGRNQVCASSSTSRRVVDFARYADRERR